jgi:uncharacterized membrane protein YeaQ/YmgE (transglycosylase-associated protein family)
MGILAWIVVGLVAGVLASLVMGGTGYGIIGDIVIGIVGAFIGGWLFSMLGISTPFGGMGGTIFVAFIGAVVLLFILRLIRGSTRCAERWRSSGDRSCSASSQSTCPTVSRWRMWC